MMRHLIAVLFVFLAVSAALACGHCGKTASCGCGPESAYTFTSTAFLPDCVPCEVRAFHSALIPMVEARRSRESSYIREKAECLYWMARQIPKADPCCCRMDQKRFVRASKSLAKCCDRLREVVHGGTSGAMYAQLREVEEEFIRVINLCD